MSIPSPLVHIDSHVGGATVGDSISFRGEDLLTDLDGWSLMRLRAFSIAGHDVGEQWSRVLEVACLCLEDTEQAKQTAKYAETIKLGGGSVAQILVGALAISNSSSSHLQFYAGTYKTLQDETVNWPHTETSGPTHPQLVEASHPILRVIREQNLTYGNFLQRAIAVSAPFVNASEILLTGLLLDLRFGINQLYQFLSFQHILSVTRVLFPSMPNATMTPFSKGESWMQAWAESAAGRSFAKAEIQLLEHIQVCTSYPDMRIWNNRVGTITVGARNPDIHGLCGFLALAEAHVYGIQVVSECVSMLDSAFRKSRLDHQPLQSFISEWMGRYGRIAGYGRPLHSNDERNTPTFNAMERLGIAKGEYLTIALEIAEYLKQKEKPVLMNAGAVFTAILMDMGFQQDAIQLFITILFISGVYPCQELALARPPSFFTKIRCDEITLI